MKQTTLKKQLLHLSLFVLLSNCTISIIYALEEWVGCSSSTNPITNLNSILKDIGYVHLNCMTQSLVFADGREQYSVACGSMFTLKNASNICKSLEPTGGGAVLGWTALSSSFSSSTGSNYAGWCAAGSWGWCTSPRTVLSSDYPIFLNWACPKNSFNPNIGFSWDQNGYSKFYQTSSNCAVTGSNAPRYLNLLWYKP